MIALNRRVFMFFFFSSRRRHTRFDCDWSSDVCSSDLRLPQPDGPAPLESQPDHARPHARQPECEQDPGVGLWRCEIGRAACRGRGEISVGAVSFKKKKKKKIRTDIIRNMSPTLYSVHR